MRLRSSLTIRTLTIAIAALGLLARSEVEASSIYSVVDLDANATGLYLNNAGQVAGTRTTANGQSSIGFVYTNGQYTNLTPGVQPIALTDSGKVIDARGPFSFYYGQNLERDSIYAGPATAANQNGVLVGTGSQQPYINLNDQTIQPVAYIYQPIPGLQAKDNGQFVDYHALGGSLFVNNPFDPLLPGDPTGQGYMNLLKWQTQLSAINNSNQVAGSYAFNSQPNNVDSFSPYHAFTSTYLASTQFAGTNLANYKDLGTLGGSNSFSTAINQIGQVVGGSDTVGGTNHAFFYNGTKMVDLGVLPGMTGSIALGLNDKGQVVGSSGIIASYAPGLFGYQATSSTISFKEVSGYTDGHAFLYSNGIMEDLNDRLSATSGLILDKAVAINDVGQILAYGHGSDGVERTVLLSPLPTPEPTTLALLGMAVVGYSFQRQRRAQGLTPARAGG